MRPGRSSSGCFSSACCLSGPANSASTKPRLCSRIPEDEESGDELDGGEKGFGEFVVAGREAAKLFELVEEAFDAVAAPIEFLVVGEPGAAAGDRRDHGRNAVERETRAEAIGIGAFVEGRKFQDVVR